MSEELNRTRDLLSVVCALVMAATIVCVLAGCNAFGEITEDGSQHSSPPATSIELPAEGGVPAQMLRVIDGDTIAVAPTTALPGNNDTGTEHIIRLLGIDTPERNLRSRQPAECGADEATERLAELLPEGQRLTVTFDPNSASSDRYNRSLAFISTPQINDVGYQLIVDGYATAWYPDSAPAPLNHDHYQAAEEIAARSDAGMHALCDTGLGRG